MNIYADISIIIPNSILVVRSHFIAILDVLLEVAALPSGDSAGAQFLWAGRTTCEKRLWGDDCYQYLVEEIMYLVVYCLPTASPSPRASDAARPRSHDQHIKRQRSNGASVVNSIGRQPWCGAFQRAPLGGAPSGPCPLAPESGS